MVRQVNVTGAESCWDDGFADDEDCESYLRNQKSRTMAEEANADVDEDDDAEEEDDTDDADDDSSDDVTAEAEDASTEDDEEPEEADESEATAEEDSEIASEANPEEGAKMIKAKSGGKGTKADAIRAVIEAKQAAGVEFRPRDVIEALKKKGIEVNASQVSITLRAMGVPALKRGLAAKGAPTAAAKPVAAETEEPARRRATAKFRAVEPHAVTNGDGVSSNMVEQAADFMHAAGGYDEAVSLLNLCRKVMQRG
jgi:hypothetical protein